MTPEEREQLIFAVTSAHRDRDPHGEIRGHRAFFDLDEEGRVAAHDETVKLRALERAVSGDGLTTTARAILARIRRG